MPDNESKIDITAMAEAIEAFRQRIKDLDAEVERINTARAEQGEPKLATAGITQAAEAVRQLVKDLDAAVQRIRGARREN